MQKIILNLWFDTQAEDAAKYYVSLFPNSKIGNITYYSGSSSDVAGMPVNSVLTVEFTLDGQDYIAMNGGPIFKFTPATSLLVNCTSQEEVDRLWDALCSGGEAGQCGWLTDKFGFSWQIVPTELSRLLSDGNPEKTERVLQALYKMSKIEIDDLLAAYNSI